MAGRPEPVPQPDPHLQQLLRSLEQAETGLLAERQHQQRVAEVRGQIERVITELTEVVSRELTAVPGSADVPDPRPDVWDRFKALVDELVRLGRDGGHLRAWNATDRRSMEDSIRANATAAADHALTAFRTGCHLADLALEGRLTTEVLQVTWRIGEAGRAAVGILVFLLGMTLVEPLMALQSGAPSWGANAGPIYSAPGTGPVPRVLLGEPLGSTVPAADGGTQPKSAGDALGKPDTLTEGADDFGQAGREPNANLVPAGPFRLKPTGGGYLVSGFGEEGHFPAVQGFGALRLLVQQPGRPVSWADLDPGMRVAGPRSAQPALDAAAMSSVLADLERLRREIEESENDAERADSQRRYDELLTQLRTDSGPGRKVRDLNSLTDKLRPKIVGRLKTAYQKLRDATPPLNKLADHLENSVSACRTGFVYSPPSPAPAWETGEDRK